MNLRAIAAIYRFEMGRTFRTLGQSVLSPVLTTSLYFVVFGAAIGSRMDDQAEEIRRDLKSSRRGPVTVMVTEPGWEAEIELRETCPVTPQVIGAVKVLPGVAHIEQF